MYVRTSYVTHLPYDAVWEYVEELPLGGLLAHHLVPLTELAPVVRVPVEVLHGGRVQPPHQLGGYLHLKRKDGLFINYVLTILTF